MPDDGKFALKYAGYAGTEAPLSINSDGTFTTTMPVPADFDEPELHLHVLYDGVPVGWGYLYDQAW